MVIENSLSSPYRVRSFSPTPPPVSPPLLAAPPETAAQPMEMGPEGPANNFFLFF